MSNTSNFDYAVELGIDSVRQIFHLAFKSEDLYPHNIGPIHINLSGRAFTIFVKVLDDDDRPAGLTFQDDKHILFSFPFEVTVQTDDAPDPSLSQITLSVQAGVPGKLDNWTVDSAEVLGINFADITPAAVDITRFEGLPAIDIDNIRSAIHHKYDQIQHVYTLGVDVLQLYDDSRDMTLVPVNAATPADITATLTTVGPKDYLHVVLPIWVNVPQAFYTSFGRITFNREVVRTDTSITIDMGVEPSDAALKTVVELDGASPAKSLIITQLTPLAVNAISGFGTITEPAPSEAAARDLAKQQISDYLKPRKYPVFTPDSGDPDHPLSTPVGFLLVSDNILSILMNRRDSSVPDSAPDNFLGGNQVAMAVGRAKVDEEIARVIDQRFPNLKNGGEDIHTDQGDGTLTSLTVTPSDPGDHDQADGHLWTEGECEVHIDCWPDPDVSFSGPIFIDTTLDRSDGKCTLTAKGRAGEFDIDESCCDVLFDLFIPIVGWIMLAVVEGMIDDVGGGVIADTAAAEAEVIAPLPPVVNGVARVSACLTTLSISSQGFVFPGEITLERITTSFKELQDGNRQPRP